MNETEIKQKLDKLTELLAARDVIMLEKQRLLDEILTPEIKARMAEIESEFAQKAEAVNANIAALEAEIRQDVLAHGASVKGAVLHAIFSKGRITWDTKALEGYATAHPELLAYRREGEPSVSIRVAK